MTRDMPRVINPSSGIAPTQDINAGFYASHYSLFYSCSVSSNAGLLTEAFPSLVAQLTSSD